MFTIDQIKTAHAKVKSGADFPGYIQELIHIGIISYDTFVSDGHTEYAGPGDFRITSGAKYAVLDIARAGNADQFIQYLKMHQQGQTDYPVFCRHAAETGVEKWTVDTRAMTCTYYSKTGTVMLEEIIPSP